MLSRFVPALAVLFALGCANGRHPVKGRVVYEDGSPVPAGTVIAEATLDGKPVSVQANIESDGRFSLGGDRPGDGAPPGSYRVAVMPVALGDAERAEGKLPTVTGKFGRFESSGLKIEVTDGRNEPVLTVSKPKAKEQ